MEQFSVTGMSCAACQARVEKAVSGVEGVTDCAVSLLTNSMRVDGAFDPGDVIRAVEKAGYGAALRDAAGQAAKKDPDESLLEDRETPKLKKRLWLSAAFLLLMMYITMGHNMWGFPLPAFFVHNHLALALTQMLLAMIVMGINRKFFTSGFSALMHRAPNMDTLVALGSGVSFLWSLSALYRMCGMITGGSDNMALMDLYHNELYFESAAMIPALITVGKTLEALSKGRTTNALRELMRIRPKTAVLLIDGQEREVPVEEVRIGDVFAVRPGESFPVDGVVLTGISAADESALTGESMPMDKQAGDPVSAATINKSGYLTCRASRVGEDTALAKIIHMVTDASTTKAPIARIADKVSGVFVPTVIGIACLVTVIWLLLGRPFDQALARGICVLVISCPCALGLATPVAIMVGNGVGARNGILFKTGEALETAGKADIVVLDKTGTVTAGQPEVTLIRTAPGVDEKELLRCALSLENKSEHPLAQAVVRLASSKGVSPENTDNFTALPGNGVMADLGQKKLFGGSEKFMSGILKDGTMIGTWSAEAAGEGKTPLFFAEGERFLGMLAVEDEIKPDSAEAVSQMKNMGLRVVMLTGDTEGVAQAVARKAGIDEVIAGVLPDGKEKAVRDLQSRGKVIMIGDGINDAPALTRADVGIAIGAGTDVAVESADIVLMNSSLLDAAAAVRLSRATLKNIHENLFWAFFYNLICIPLAAGLFRVSMDPMIGAAAMSLSSFTVCMNALRLNLTKLHDTKKDRPHGGKHIREDLSPLSAAPETEDPADAAGIRERHATVHIEGMMCEHCEHAIETALGKLPGVREVRADHTKGIAVMTVDGSVSEQDVRKAVEDEDYTFCSMEGSE